MPKTGPSMASQNPAPVAPRAGPPRRRQLSRPGFTVPACPACKPVPGLDPAYIMDPEAASKKESFGCSLPSDGFYPIAAPGSGLIMPMTQCKMAFLYIPSSCRLMMR